MLRFDIFCWQTFVYYGDTSNNLVNTLFKYVFCKDPYCPAPLDITEVCGYGMNCGPGLLLFSLFIVIFIF